MHMCIQVYYLYKSVVPGVYIFNIKEFLPLFMYTVFYVVCVSTCIYMYYISETHDNAVLEMTLMNFSSK